MVCICLPNSTVTTDSDLMRQHAVEFYSPLSRMKDCSRDCVDELLQGHHQLGSEGRAALDANLSLEELTVTVGQMAPAPGLDRLPVDFSKHFWRCLGADLWEVQLECSLTGLLLASCWPAVLSLLIKK